MRVLGEIGGHQPCRASIESEWVLEHSAHSQGRQVGEATGILLLDDVDRVSGVPGSRGQTPSGLLLAGRATLGAHLCAGRDGRFRTVQNRIVEDHDLIMGRGATSIVKKTIPVLRGV